MNAASESSGKKRNNMSIRVSIVEDNGRVRGSLARLIALTDGFEWTVKVSQHEQPYLRETAVATYETYWNDSEFESYDAGDRDRLASALANERVPRNLRDVPDALDDAEL